MIHSVFAAHQFFYLDPGSGSFIIQMLLAGILGAGIAVRVYWKKIKSIFNKNSAQKTDTEAIVEEENGKEQ
jgi:hypothetical protein